jgi:hypothetical protein
MKKPKPTSLPIPNSDRILDIIAKANHVAYIEWLQAVLEEHAEPIRRELARLKASSILSEYPALDLTAIEALPNPHDGRIGYWAKMTPEERSHEMHRRMQVRRGKLHPRDPRSPQHKSWVETMRKVQKGVWENLSVKERKARVANLKAGQEKARRARKVPVVALEKAS